MAHRREYENVGGTRIKVATGLRSQTINIFDDTDVEGAYSEVFRLRGNACLATPTALGARFSDVPALAHFLDAAGAVREGPRRRR